MPVTFYSSALVTSSVIGVWDAYLLLRQRRCFDKHTTVPDLFKDTLTPEDYTAAQQYGKEHTTVSIIDHVKDVVLSTFYLVRKIPSKLYRLVASKTGLAAGSFAHLYAYGVASDVIEVLVGLPLEYYSTFVVEQKYGFNKSTKWQFFKDQIISFLLRVSLLHPVQTALIQYVVAQFGDRFPLYMFAGSAAMVFVFMLIFPAFIQPLFNTFTPLSPDSSLYAGVERVADKVGFPIDKVLEVDGSRRSAHSNAYFYGLGRRKKIVLYDTLLQQTGDDHEQVLAVLCHEMGHWKYSHTTVNLCIALAQLLAFSYGARLVIFNEDMYRQFGFEDTNAVVGFDIFSQVFLSPFSTLFGYAMSAMVRRMEFQADRFAVEHGYADAMKRALLTLSKENKENLSPDPLVSALTHSHPTTLERVAAIDAAAAAQDKKKN